MELIAFLNLEEVPEEESKTFQNRTAVRAVLFDEDNRIALMHVSKKGYYKLPGGGVDEGEELALALERECLEEAGCSIDILHELGRVDEVRRMQSLVQTSFNYIGRVRGEKRIPALTESEAADGFEIVWLGLEEALERLQQSNRENDAAAYIVLRDTAILTKAMEMINSDQTSF